MAKKFHVFFVSILKSLGIYEKFLPTSSSETRNIESMIAKFESHTSIAIISNCINNNSILSFKEIEKTEVIKEMEKLNINKISFSSNIPTRIIKRFDNLLTVFITKNFNLSLIK